MKTEKFMFVVISIFGLKMILIAIRKDFWKSLETLITRMWYVNLLPGLDIYFDLVMCDELDNDLVEVYVDPDYMAQNFHMRSYKFMFLF